MPLYEYLCRDCETEVELLIRSPQDQPECPGCGGQKLMKLLSVPQAHSPNGQSDGPPTGSCGAGCGCFPG